MLNMEVYSTDTPKQVQYNKLPDGTAEVWMRKDIIEEVTEEGGKMEEGRDQAVYYRDTVKAAMDALRAPVDKLEMIVDKDMWPMPSYGDLIFEV